MRIERRPDGDHDLVIEPEICFEGPKDAHNIQRITDEINRIVGGWGAATPIPMDVAASKISRYSAIRGLSHCSRNARMPTGRPIFAGVDKQSIGIFGSTGEEPEP